VRGQRDCRGTTEGREVGISTETGEAGAAAAEVAAEQRHVSRAYARVAALRAEAADREREGQRVDPGADERAVYERDVSVLHNARRRAELDLAGEGLVFGRLDRAAGAPLHVGRLGVRTEAQEPLVVDWRAPAAAAFYQATAAAPAGVVRRRTITSRGETVVAVEDELLDPDAAASLAGSSVVGDGAFLAAVSRERGAHMRDIVATIQAEQDAAVRAPDDGALLVTGGPGTGKTAVALHRVAYLMYARRDYYGRRGVLVVGPSGVFLDYIGRVLPALGETSVRLASLGGLPRVPAGVAVTAYDGPAVAALKGSARMAELLGRVVREAARPGQVPDLVVRRWGIPVTVPAAELTRRGGRPGRGSATRSHNSGRAATVAALVDAAWRAWSRRPQATRLEADDRSEFAAWLRGEPEFQRVADALWPVLLPGPVFAALRRGDLPLARLARGLYDDAELALLRASWAGGGAAISPADAAILDELAELLGAPPEPEPEDDDDDPLAELVEPGYGEVTTFAERTRRVQRDLSAELDYRSYAHVVVDEAQDVSPMQWRALGRRGRGATWTIVGDWAQSAWPDVAEVRAAMTEALGRARVREVPLRTNYRTSTEIAALAAGLLARLDPAAVPPAAVRTTGFEPVVCAGAPAELPDLLAAAVGTVLGQVGGAVGVVCPHAALPAALERLAALRAEHPRLAVLDPWQVKGLEFDGCVVYQPEGVVGEGLTRVSGLRTLYVAVTRATTRLTLVTAALPPELVPA